MKVYDKLVRDRIPEIIEASGSKCEIETVSDEVALEYLYKKLHEEVEELLSDKNLDEIADIMEVLFAIGKKYGYSEDEVLGRRNEKRDSRGGFEDNLILKKTFYFIRRLFIYKELFINILTNFSCLSCSTSTFHFEFLSKNILLPLNTSILSFKYFSFFS